MRTATTPQSFALLDNSQSLADSSACRLYTDLSHLRACHLPEQLEQLCRDLNRDQAQGLHAVVVADYEWASHLQRGQPSRHATTPKPALRFLLFRQMTLLSSEQAASWLQACDSNDSEPGIAGICDLKASVSPQAFHQAIERIHQSLTAGDAYQVNYTYRLFFSAFGNPIALYRRLRQRQAVAYGALIALPDQRWILSCSPELFIRHQSGQLQAQPMKGTAARGSDPSADSDAQQTLASCPKNQAENLMIVDLLRNDMGMLAQTGSVTVPSLFTVEPYQTVWQMTSSIEARLSPDTGFAKLLRALFPCGSITGAPKQATVELIEQLETSPRGLYTGAIGWLDAPTGPNRQCGDFCLSVAIRTLTLEAADAHAWRAGQLGVGAGIVLDSEPHAELAECQLKAQFLTGAEPGFTLFETCYATREHGIRHWQQHLHRLSASAHRFGFAFDQAQLIMQTHSLCQQLPAQTPHRLRIRLHKSGEIQLEHGRLAALPAGPVQLLLAEEYGFAPTDARNPFLQYKSSIRQEYDQAWQMAAQHGAFDMLFFNQAGQLTEGGRCNVLVKLDQQWCTPPLAAGILPGIMRSILLKDTKLAVIERPIQRHALLQASELLVCNALRGAIPATLKPS